MAHDLNLHGGSNSPRQAIDSIATGSPRLPPNVSYEAMADMQEHEYFVGELDEEDIMNDISDADAQSIMEPAISRAATRLTSPKTPAAEKAAAMDNLEGGMYFESDGEVTPPTAPSFPEFSRRSDYPEKLPIRLKNVPDNEAGLFLQKLPTQNQPDPGFPSPWVEGPKPLAINHPAETRSALKEALTGVRPRATSWSADAFKKFLPSLPKSSSFISSGSFFSSGGDQKTRNRGFSLYKDQPITPPTPMVSTLRRETRQPKPDAMNSTKDSVIPTDGLSTPKVPAIRRVASDESLLYHTLSRASSLGDDARFENQHEMVNSRGKAIRDSFQDRSTFKLPALPNMPSMPRVPNFAHAMNFALSISNSVPPTKSKADADSVRDILPGNVKSRSPTPNPTAALGVVDAAVFRPEAADTALLDVEGGETYLDRAMADLTGDIVIMGGYRGSVLRSTKTNQQVWAPIKVGLNIRKVNMEVGLNLEDEEKMEESIYPSGMLQHVGPIDISRRLFKKLRSCENAKNGTLRVWDYGYDWRLSPHLLSKNLIKFMEMLPSNQSKGPKKGALVIAHSLGGLITRHAINQSPELFSGAVYAGVPQSCVNILGPIRNGDAVLLSSRVLTAQVNFTIRTTFALLPLDGYCFIDKNRKDEYNVDFFDVNDWIKYRFSPCTDPPLPPKKQPTGSLANILNGSLTNLALPRKISLNSISKSRSSSNLVESQQVQPSHLNAALENIMQKTEIPDRTLAPQMGNLSNPVNRGQSSSSSISTTVTLPRDKAVAYLRRTLAEVKKFKLELNYNADLGTAGRYPPVAVIYGKSVPTVYGARVDGRDGIACADSYDDLAFASGDGVCLAKEAMVPDGYSCVKGGRISSDRGHVTLLGDLNAVGRAIIAVRRGRMKGIGLLVD